MCVCGSSDGVQENATCRHADTRTQRSVYRRCTYDLNATNPQETSLKRNPVGHLKLLKTLSMKRNGRVQHVRKLGSRLSPVTITVELRGTSICLRMSKVSLLDITTIP